MNEEKPVNEMWAIVEVFGHGMAAGCIRPSDLLGGLLRVDIPDGDSFRTEYYGEKAIFSIKPCSEEIARAYAAPDKEVYVYNAPIVPRAMYEQALERVNRQNETQRRQIDELQRRLTAVDALPARASAMTDEGDPGGESRLADHNFHYGDDSEED